MQQNGESVYGCALVDLPKPEWGRYTQKGNRLHAHIYDRGIGPINFRGLSGKIKQARLLADGSEVKFSSSRFQEKRDSSLASCQSGGVRSTCSE